MPQKRTLLIHMPVIHRGYLDFLTKQARLVDRVYLIPETIFNQLSEFKTDIAALPSAAIKKWLPLFGLGNVQILSAADCRRLAKIKTPIMLVNDEVSRALAEKYFKNNDVNWQAVFLRWDRTKVFAEKKVSGKITTVNFDQKMMKLAYAEVGKSSDWWRQVGAVAVKNKKILFNTYNKTLPNDHTPYQVGAVRDFVKVGERPDLSNTIHSEQWIVAEAARRGANLTDAALYVTHFPCSVCARLIAMSGIKKLYYGEGSSNLDGEKVLQAANVAIVKVLLGSKK